MLIKHALVIAALVFPGVTQAHADAGFYVDPDSSPALWVRAHQADPRAPRIAESIANVPMARWFGNWSGDVHKADQVVMRERPSIIVLDLMMPGIDGLTALTRLRADNDDTPVIMLTARADGIDRVVGLEMGADDYLGKPFMPRELLARINAVLRRQGVSRSPSPTSQRLQPVRFGCFELDNDRRTLTRDGEPQRLTNSELRLLNVLVRLPMETLSRSRPLTLWYGTHADVTERGIDVPIWRLRQRTRCDRARASRNT
jgi:two-component system, OmpR family, phosphate regulon response regulator OmpR